MPFEFNTLRQNNLKELKKDLYGSCGVSYPISRQVKVTNFTRKDGHSRVSTDFVINISKLCEMIFQQISQPHSHGSMIHEKISDLGCHVTLNIAPLD